jgi:hypothetical protein
MKCRIRNKSPNEINVLKCSDWFAYFKCDDGFSCGMVAE